MKTFKDIREAKNKSMPSGEHVFDQKIKGVDVMIHKQGNKFVVYIDKEKLDDYTSLAQAKKMGIEFAKEASK